MSSVLTDEVARFVDATSPDPDETLIEMDEYAAAHGFPHVGPEVGGVLRLLARVTDAARIFEFGSGYGYSAYWFAEALPDDGEIVLTEVDADELELAREYLDRGGYGNRATYELGDAMETIEAYDGPFDVVLIDHQKHQYPAAFDAVKPKVPVGGVIVADNAMRAGSIQFDRLLEIVEQRARERRTSETSTEPTPIDGADLNESTRGIATYLQRVRADPDFETICLPVGEGIAVSYRVS